MSANIEMIQKEFLAEKKYQGLTENSLTSYVQFFKTWNGWLKENNLERIDQLNGRNTKAFLHDFIEKGNKPRTVNTKLKLMRAFANWMVEEKLLEEPFTKGAKMVREEDSPKILIDKDLRDVLRHLRRQHRREHSFTSRRNYTLILFLAGTGMRLAEVCSLKWTDIEFDNSLIMIRTSKSRKAQSVPLSDQLKEELEDYQSWLKSKLGKLPSSVFTTKEGKNLKPDSIQNVFKRLRTTLGIEGYFSPHTLRNYFIKGVLKNGLNLREAQLLARHSKIDVTRKYVGYFQHELKESLDIANPLKDLL